MSKQNSQEAMASKLQEAGHRMTKTRRALLSFFYSELKPVGAEYVQTWLRVEGIEVHRATLYRELEFLTEQRVIHQLSIPGATMYELVETGHHHHVVCLKCKVVQDVDVRDRIDLKHKQLEKQTNFIITHHSLEFFGLCANCQ